MEKQAAGFKYGKYKTRTVKEFGAIEYKGRTYKLVLVRTQDGLSYYALRLFNAGGHFIKQFMFEPEIRLGISKLLNESEVTKHG